ncbi:hypothetical protein F0U61_44635 [Archangium violaceum]|uniref:hypothetical protein n=1 Tax=Archangium violaceum TaxID=83451 RepID=UPI002B2E0692|nr:hypothetical protein F0U61_44635 [Archangium violaceum]
MKKRLSRLPIRAWTTSLMALSCSLGWAQDVNRVFVQGSEINLRGAPSTSAEVVKKVTIGTECQQLEEAPKQWVKLKCGEVEGYTLKSLVGVDKPSFDALLAQAQDTATDTKVRLDAAARAATLESQNEQALQLLADLFFEVNFKQLQKDKKKGGLHESFVATCNEVYSGRPRRTYQECLTRELEKIEYDWHQVRFQDNDFISAMYREGSLVVFTGRISPRRGKGLLNDEDDDFNILVESRSTSAVSDALKLALLKGATSSSTADEKRPANEQKYSSWYGEYSGMPVLDAASLQLYRSLPPVWYLLHEERGTRYVRSACGVVHAAMLRLDIHRRAGLYYGEANGSYDNVARAMRVVGVTKSDSSFQLQLRGDEGDDQLILTWPTAEANVALWQRKGAIKPIQYFAPAHAKNIEVRKECREAAE